jgi:hypothetical protein
MFCGRSKDLDMNKKAGTGAPATFKSIELVQQAVLPKALRTRLSFIVRTLTA